MKFQKQISLCIVLILLFSMMLTACGQDVPETPDTPDTTGTPATTSASVIVAPEPLDAEEVTLHVLAENPGMMGKNAMLVKLIDKTIRAVEADFDGLAFEVEYLPSDEMERAAELDIIRDEIAAGGGPDIFLFTRSQPSFMPFASENIILEPLFPDVTTAMDAGVFADISEFYNADTQLDKDSFAGGVMEAGAIGNARYVLPLRYNFPVAYVDMTKFADTGLSTDIFSSGGNALLHTLVENEVPVCVESGKDPFRAMAFSLLPDALVEDDLVDYLTQYQILLPSLEAESYTTSISRFVNDPELNMYWGYNDFSPLCVQFGTLDIAVEQAALAQAVGMDLGMFPIIRDDGTLVADITMYGAVNANCLQAEAAYRFIASFLTKESQWEIQITGNGVSLDGRMMAEGYPVLAKGSAEAVFTIANIGREGSEMQEAVNALEITDEDVPILATDVQARFPTWAEVDLNRKMKNLLDTPAAEIPTIVQVWFQIRASQNLQ